MVDPTADVPAEAIDALWRGNKIAAIKMVRRACNLDLKSAKTQVEEYVRNDPALQQKLATVQAETMAGVLRWLVIFGILAIGGYYFVIRD